LKQAVERLLVQITENGNVPALRPGVGIMEEVVGVLAQLLGEVAADTRALLSALARGPVAEVDAQGVAASGSRESASTALVLEHQPAQAGLDLANRGPGRRLRQAERGRWR
jgi:hypothetical protein